MLKNILFATDVSEASNRVLECIKPLRGAGSQNALLVHVLDVQNVGGLHEMLRKMLLPELEAQRKKLEAAGFNVAVEMPFGMPYYEINRLARERDCALVVIGSHGASLVKEMLLGSNVHALLQNAIVPVLLVRLEAVEENGERRCRSACENFFSHVLHPTDFSDVSERAFQYLEHIAGDTGCEVTLLHVQDRARIDPHLKHRLEEFNRIDAERLERRKERLKALGAKAVHIEIPYGSPTGLILERARKGGFSLILMGTQGRGFIKEIFLGSVAHNVARHAPLPVLFVPAVR